MVEIIPKKPEREIPLKNASLFIAGALLLAAIFSYVILARSEANALLAIQDLEDGIFKAGTSQDREIETKVLDSEKKIKDFKVLLAGSRKPSQFFGNFGDLIHPKIWFSSFELDAVQAQASISGQALDFRTLEQQLIFLQSKNDIIEKIDLSDIALGEEGNVNFSINFKFRPDIFLPTADLP